MKVKFKIINGQWTNDDIDLIPTIKLRTSSKQFYETTVKATSVALCWLKWGVMISFGSVKKDLLPMILLTKGDYETVLNHYLPNQWEMSHQYNDGFHVIDIKLKTDKPKRKINELKNYIREHKSCYIIVNINREV